MSRSSSAAIRILLIAKDILIRSGFKILLESNPGLKVCGEAGNEQEAANLAGKEQPDIVLLYDDMTGETGWMDALPRLMALLNRPRIILITSSENAQDHVRAVRNGALGIVTTNLPPEILFKAIEKIHAGEAWLDRSLVASFLVQGSNSMLSFRDDPRVKKIAQLSAREREIIALVGEGLKNQQIADRLFLSEVTVRHHLTSVFKKLGVTDRLELVIYAYQNDLAKLPE